MKAATALEELRAVLPTFRPGFLPWYEKLSPADAATFGEIKRAHAAGELQQPKNTVARGVCVMLQARGIDITKQSVVRWLDS
jgi:hypothetical protein